MIETINEQQIEFANKIREYDLSHETGLRFSTPRLDVNFWDDGASFPLLESGLEEVLDPPLTTVPFVGYLGLFCHWWHAYVYMCVLLFVWVRFGFEIYVSVYFVSCFMFLDILLCFVFWIFVLLVLWLFGS